MDTFWPLGDVEQGNSMGRMPVCSIRDYLQFMTEPTMNQIIKMRYQGPLGGGGRFSQNSSTMVNREILGGGEGLGEIFENFCNHGEQ